MPTPFPKRLEMHLAEDGGTKVVGVVEIDTTFHLKVVSAQERHLRLIEETVQRMNQKEVLDAAAPPPPDAPRFAVSSYEVPRDDPEFWPELQKYLQTYYDLTFTEVAG